MERTMFYGASNDLFAKAKLLRENMTVYEKLLWEKLKENKTGVRFKPQHPIDIFIADFYCHALKLVIELDGEIHNNQKEYDEGRTAELQNHEVTVIRFTNEEVKNNIENVILKIKKTIEDIKSKKYLNNS